MGIQDAREKIAATAGAFAKADPKFSADIESRYNALKEKSQNPHPADMRRIQNELSDWASAYLEGKTFNREALDCAQAWRDLCQAEIDLVVFSQAAGFPSGEKLGGWVDIKTGNPVALLAPNEKFSAGKRADATVGELMAAMAFGSKDARINNVLEEGTNTAGGYTVPTKVLPDFIDALRSKSVFVEAGAQTLQIDAKSVSIARVDSDPVPAWRAESAAVTITDPTFGVVTLAPKSLACIIKVSVELLQDSVNIADILQRVLVKAMALKLDQAALFGAGTSTEPQGLFGTTNVNSVSMGTNGATPSSWDEHVDSLYEIEFDNAGPPTAAIWHPRTAKTMRKLKDTTNQPLQLPPAIRDLPYLSTTSVPITQTQGTASGVCSTVLFGDFTQAILGMRQELIIRPLNELYAANLQVGFEASLRADVAFAHPESFTKLIGIKP